jgi:regulatory protein
MHEEQIRKAALNALARREYASAELKQKLINKRFDSDAVIKVVNELKLQGLQSDDRFAEHVVNVRINHGYGPKHIIMELRSKGISEELIAAIVDREKASWPSLAKKVRSKRFGAIMPADSAARAKQARFLQYRGFDFDTIYSIFKE